MYGKKSLPATDIICGSTPNSFNEYAMFPAVPPNCLLSLSAKNESEILRRSNLSKSNYKCEELGGKICSEKEACSEQYKESADGKCCLEKCIKIKENSKAWIGYLIAGIVLLSLIYLYMKYKGTEKNKDFIDKNIEEKNVP